MAESNLLETYNPLYDVHLRQYFASPNMQKHLRNLGLLDSNGVPVAQEDNNVEGQLYARHQMMMDKMLHNRERVLMQLADLQKKLDAAEKVEIYRRIRSGITNAEEFRRHHLTTRSFSRPARGRVRDQQNDRQRRHSNSYDESELVKRIENDIDAAQNEYAQQHKSLYSRLAANAYKYQYLHKLDDRTLLNYKETLRRQLQKLERFREVSFGPHSVAKHQPNLQTSWFFRRRSLPTLKTGDSTATSQKPAPRPVPQRNSKSAGRQRAGKSCSPHRANRLPAAPTSGQPAQQRKPKPKQAARKLPPLPKQQSKAKTTSSSFSTATQKLPPTAVVKPSKKREKEAEKRTSSGASVDKLPKIAVAGALAGGAALAASTLIASDPEPQPEISDTDYSRPETEASDALPSDAEQSIGTSPQPHSDIEPEFQQEHTQQSFADQQEFEQATPKEEHSFSYEQQHGEPIVEDPVHKIQQHHVEAEQLEDFTPVEEHARHVRSVDVESQPPVTDRSIEDDYAQNEQHAYVEPTQNEAAYDSAIYSSDSNPLHDEQKLEETPRSFNDHPQSDIDDDQSEATHNAEHSAFSPRSMNEDELSPHEVKEEHEIRLDEEHVDRNETPMSKDSIEPAEQETQPVEPVSHFEVSSKHEEFEDETPQQESRQFGEEEPISEHYNQSELPATYEHELEHEPVQHDLEHASERAESPNSQMQASVYHQQEEEELEHEPVQHDLEHASEPEHPESPTSQQHDFERQSIHHEINESVYEHPESPSVQMNESVYHQEEAEPIQHAHSESPTSQMSKSFSHQQEEHEQPEDEVASVKNYHQEHRDSFEGSESEPNLHYQTESFQPIESQPEEAEHHAEEDRFQQHFDLSNDTSIPVMEGESWRDSEDETQPVSGQPDGDSLTAVESLHIDGSPRQQHFENYEEMAARDNDSIRETEEDSQSHEFETESVEHVPEIQNEEQEIPAHEEHQFSPPQSANNALLVAQPSIEITPASDYSGSREHLDRIGESATPELPKTPSSVSDQNDDSGHPTEHEGLDSDHQMTEDHNITPPSTGKSTDHHDFDSHNEPQGDDIETIPPPTSHSPLTVEHEETHEEHYRLPESPDPSAHNTLIPEQHEDNALTVPDDEELAPRDHVPEEEQHQEFESSHNVHELNSNYESQHDLESHHDQSVADQSVFEPSAPNTERSYGEHDVYTPHTEEQHRADEMHTSEHDTNQNEGFEHAEQHVHLDDDHNGNQNHMETAYQHEYQLSNGHVEQDGDHHSDEEVFNSGLNGNHQNGSSNGYHHEEPVVRKSVGDEEALDSEKEETGSVIIRDESPELHKPEQVADGQTGASQL